MLLEKLTVRALAGVLVSLLALVPNNLVRLAPTAFAQEQTSNFNCVPVGGALMTNIGAIAGVTNLGPVSGDLAGSVAATILGQNSNGTYNVQHYWVTAAGDTITLTDTPEGGLRVTSATAGQEQFAHQMKAAEGVIRRYRDALSELAK